MSKKELAVRENREVIGFEDSAWFQRMIQSAKNAMEEFNTAKTELSFQLKWHEIEAKHKIGELLVKNKEHAKGKFTQLSQLTGKTLGISSTVIDQCIQVYKAFPDIDDIPEGKSIGWTRLIKVYIEGGADPKGCVHGNYSIVRIRVCGKCGKRTVLKDEGDEESDHDHDEDEAG